MRPAIPLVDLLDVHEPLLDDLHEAFDTVLRSSSFTAGEQVDIFEAALAHEVGTGHAVAVGSGTAALHLSLVAAGIGRGDEVILPPNTFFATAEAVVAAGATPVLADVDPSTALLDPAAAEAAVTERTAAIVPVHLYGQPVDAGAFLALARRYGLFLLEDACQALGAAWQGQPAGGLGDAAAFSFYPTKNLGALGDAGAVMTDDVDLAARVRALRNHGEASKHEHRAFGLCERMDGLQAAFLLVKLRHLGAHQRDRHRLAAAYHARLARAGGAVPLRTDPRARHAHHLMVVRIGWRDAVLRDLRRRGIGAAVHYPTPIHLQPGATGLGRAGSFPNAEQLCASVLSLPLWPGMGTDVVGRVVITLERSVRSTAPSHAEEAVG